jgi:hypothetical protein
MAVIVAVIGACMLCASAQHATAQSTRAVGFYPGRKAVDVIDGAPPVVFALETFKSVLDTMNVRANYDRYSQLEGIRERRRSGIGRYLGGTEIARRAPIQTSDLFRTIPGVYLEPASSANMQSVFNDGGTADPFDGDTPEGLAFVMRGTFARRCIPRIYWNDTLLPKSVSASELDALIQPQNIVGIEVYASTAVPPQFQQGLGGCGSLVFWTK